jgi:dihydrodipicolinate synthase/N-acetylneuraminate lyase
MKFVGTGVPLATPFDESGVVNHAALATLAERLVDHGVEFLVPCGSASEAPLLRPDERVAVVETTAEAVDVTAVAGTGTPGLERTLDLTRRAAAAGADAALVVTPYYFPQDADGLRSYYEAVADAAPVPVYLYSVPAFTGVTLPVEVVANLVASETFLRRQTTVPRPMARPVCLKWDDHDWSESPRSVPNEEHMTPQVASVGW